MSVIAQPRRRLALPSLPAVNWQWVVIGILAMIVAYDNRGVFAWFSTDLPAVKAGNAYRSDLCAAWADGFDAGGNVITAGGTVQDAEAALKQAALIAHQASFAKTYSPAFAALVPAGTQPKDPATRAKYAQLFHDFATGLRRRWWFW